LRKVQRKIFKTRNSIHTNYSLNNIVKMMAQLIMNELSIKKDRERESERIKRG
jgi:hypothetical protein